MKNNFVSTINILSGKIIYNDFDIDENRSFQDQIYSFKEDILQIAYGDRFVVDVGWYPEFKQTGHFLVRIIKDEDWEKPLFKKKCTKLIDLKESIEEAAIIIESN